MDTYEKAYKAVLNTAKQWIKDGCTDKERICLECVFPELRENEDERILREIISALKFANDGGVYDEHIAYLEKQKYDRMKPIYDAKESFESALEKAWKDYNDSGARTVDGCEDDYVECAHAKGFREGYLFGLVKQKESLHIQESCKENADSFTSEDERIRQALCDIVRDMPYMETELRAHGLNVERVLAYLEKQKEASKAIEAIERIDKYIDEQLANAHDMKDSNPNKKYYRGWDDALGKMAGILEDVYSGKKQEESLKNFIDDFPYSAEQKEQKPKNILTDDDSLQTAYLKGQTDVLEDPEAYGLQKEQKPVEIHIDNPNIQKVDPDVEITTSDSSASGKELLYVSNKSYKIGFRDGVASVKPAEINEYEIIKKHITKDSLSSDVNKRLTECGWYVTDEKLAEWSKEEKDYYDTIVRKLEVIGDDCGLSDNQIKFLREHCPSHRSKWSEEDEKIVKFYEADYNNQIGDMSMKDVINMRLEFKNWLVNRLKFLRPQPKQEWGEEDIQRIRKEEYTKGFNDAAFGGKAWKPSEEQMENLEMCFTPSGAMPDFCVLESLYDDLKKLK